MLINEKNLHPIPNSYEQLAKELDPLGFNVVIREPGKERVHIQDKETEAILSILTREDLKDNGIKSVVENIKDGQNN